jgi:hypothetical protein
LVCILCILGAARKRLCLGRLVFFGRDFCGTGQAILSTVFVGQILSSCFVLRYTLIVCKQVKSVVPIICLRVTTTRARTIVGTTTCGAHVVALSAHVDLFNKVVVVVVTGTRTSTVSNSNHFIFVIIITAVTV